MGNRTGERQSKDWESCPAQSRCCSWMCSPRPLPWIACWELGLHPITSASSRVPVKGDNQRSLLLQVRFPPFILRGMICLLHWLDGLETAWWADLGLGLPPILPAGPERRNSVYRSGLQRLFCQSIGQETCKYFSFDFSRVKSLLHYSFNCSKKLSLLMPEGVNINHLSAGIGLALCKYPPDCFSLDL